MTALIPGELVGMNRRKSLLVISLWPKPYGSADVPPFSKVYNTIVVRVDVVEEVVEARVGDGQTGADKGSAQLVLVEVAIVVAVYALEELPELSFGLIDEFAELFVGSAGCIFRVGQASCC
jgi:hypothetical protein